MLWTFAITALVMCGAVVACFTSSWSQIWWISSFLLVFTLCKIWLANALFHVMIRYDAARDQARLEAKLPPRPNPPLRRRPARPHDVLRVAASATNSPRPRAPR